MRGAQRLLSRVVLFLLVSFTLFSACAEASPQNAVPMPTLTAIEETTPAIAPTAGASRTIPPSATPESTPSPTPAPPPNPEIDYPLASDNTWVFQSTRYQGYPPGQATTGTLFIVETVVDVQDASPYFIAKVHQDQSQEAPVVVPDGQRSRLRPDRPGDYWLVFKENRVLYRQENKLDLSKLEEALVKFVFPLQIGDKWALTENQTKMLPPGRDPGMTRQVVRQGSVVVPAGRFTDCLLLREEWAGFTLEDWFCPNVGIVESKGDHQGAPEGWHRVLIRYDLKR